VNYSILLSSAEENEGQTQLGLMTFWARRSSQKTLRLAPNLKPRHAANASYRNGIREENSGGARHYPPRRLKMKNGRRNDDPTAKSAIGGCGAALPLLPFLGVRKKEHLNQCHVESGNISFSRTHPEIQTTLERGGVVIAVPARRFDVVLKIP
jgi:hypothetical protein